MPGANCIGAIVILKAKAANGVDFVPRQERTVEPVAPLLLAPSGASWRSRGGLESATGEQGSGAFGRPFSENLEDRREAALETATGRPHI